jgi:tetratricopeptide (TPR) repeat protein
MPMVLLVLAIMLFQGCSAPPRDYLNAGIQLYDKKQYDKASEEFTKAINKKNDFTEAYLYRGMCRLNSADAAGAKSDFSKTIELEPANGQALVKLAEISILENNFPGAMEFLKKAARTNNSAAVNNLMGVASYRQGKFDDAFKYYSAAAAMEPENADVQGNLGVYYYEVKRDVAQAKTCIEKSLKINPSSSELNRRLGNIHQLSGDYDKSIKSYESAITLDPSNGDAVQDLAFAFYQMGDYEQSLKNLEKLPKSKADAPLAHVLRGMLYLQEKDGKDKAKAEYEKAAGMKPELPDARIRLGLFYMEQEKDPKKAATEFEAAVKIAPMSAIANYFAAKSLTLSGSKDKAAKYLNTALKYNPRIYYEDAVMPQTYFSGKQKDESIKLLLEISTLQNKGDFSTALVKALEYVSLYPDMPMGHFMAGNIYYISGKPEEAVKSYNQALQLMPDFMQAFLSRGNVLFDMGKNQEALADYEEALRLDPLCIPAMTSIGNVYALGFNNYDRALKLFVTALSITPDYCEAYFFKGKCLIKLSKKKEAGEAFEKFLKLAGDGYPAQKKMAEEDLKKLKSSAK